MDTILMTTENAKAILDGRKSQTRRPIKIPLNIKGTFDQVVKDTHDFYVISKSELDEMGIPKWIHNQKIKCRYGQVGDRLYVKENFTVKQFSECGKLNIEYEDGSWAIEQLTEEEFEKYKRWKYPFGKKSKLFMFKSLSRITLEITDIRVERVADICIDDILKEGIKENNTDSEYWRENTLEDFIQLWDSINKKRGYGWDVNPWVWVIEFIRILEQKHSGIFTF
ncbi:MAG: hypothetical protein ACW972_12520 [Promethearchaeota archaeon]|jgi:hypothetical protein